MILSEWNRPLSRLTGTFKKVRLRHKNKSNKPSSCLKFFTKSSLTLADPRSAKPIPRVDKVKGYTFDTVNEILNDYTLKCCETSLFLFDTFHAESEQKASSLVLK